MLAKDYEPFLDRLKIHLIATTLKHINIDFCSFSCFKDKIFKCADFQWNVEYKIVQVYKEKKKKTETIKSTKYKFGERLKVILWENNISWRHFSSRQQRENMSWLWNMFHSCLLIFTSKLVGYIKRVNFYGTVSFSHSPHYFLIFINY